MMTKIPPADAFCDWLRKFLRNGRMPNLTERIAMREHAASIGKAAQFDAIIAEREAEIEAAKVKRSK